MEKLNMAKINTLIREGYLLAGIMMAANMFVMNEMRASKINSKNNNNEINNKTNPIINNDKNTEQKIDIRSFFPIGPCKYIGFLLQWKNTINLVGGALFTLANSYYKFYENKPGFYFDYYFAGWNSNPFAKGYLQFCPNLNLGRGIFYLIMNYVMRKFVDNYVGTIKKDLAKKGANKEEQNAFVFKYFYYLFNEYTPCVIGNKLAKKVNEKISIFILLQLQNFVSVPLIIHLTSEFTISIAFDAIMWMVVTHFVVGDTYNAEVGQLKDLLTNLFFPKKMNSIQN